MVEKRKDSCCCLFLGCGFFQIPDLFDKVGLLIVELLVVRAILLEVAQEVDEFGLILEQDVGDGLRLVGIRHKHLHTAATGGGEQVGSFSRVAAFSVSPK